MGRSNLFLAIASWLLFLWGTFLTRSGVLANVSVHAFDMLGSSALYILIGMIGVHGIAGFALLAWRWRTIPTRPISDRVLSRDSAMVVAVSIMIVSAAVVALASSWPLISRWPILKTVGLGSFYSATGMLAQPIFYNKFGSVIAIPMLLIMGAVPFLAWGRTNSEKFLWKVLVPWLSAIGIGALVVWFAVSQESIIHAMQEPKPIGTPRILVVVLGMLGAFAMLANLALVKRILKPTTTSKTARWTGIALVVGAGIVLPIVVLEVSLPLGVMLFALAGIAAGLYTLRVKGVTAGGWLAHVGIGLLLLGTVLTNVYEKTEIVGVVEGMGPTKSLYGYSIEFAGWTHDDLQKKIDAETDPQEAERLQNRMDEDWRKYSHGVLLKVIPDKKGAVVQADDAGASASTPPGGFIAKAPVFLNIQAMAGGDGPQTMRWPYIHKELDRDYYISIANDPAHSRPGAVLRPGETKGLSYLYSGEPVVNTSYMVHYKDFFMNGSPGGEGTEMGAVVELIGPDGRTYEARPSMKVGGPRGPQMVPAAIPGMNAVAVLSGRIDPATKSATVEFELPDAGPRWIVPVAVTDKPWINLVWLGVITMGVGTIVAMVRRSLEARKGAMVSSDAAAGEVEAEPEETVRARPAVPATVTAKSDTSGAGLPNPAKSKPARAKS
jgi:cytochrome c-type biogenesis protein CcmF